MSIYWRMKEVFTIVGVSLGITTIVGVVIGSLLVGGLGNNIIATRVVLQDEGIPIVFSLCFELFFCFGC